MVIGYRLLVIEFKKTKTINYYCKDAIHRVSNIKQNEII